MVYILQRLKHTCLSLEADTPRKTLQELQPAFLKSLMRQRPILAFILPCAASLKKPVRILAGGLSE
jgi:hypothetical protein